MMPAALPQNPFVGLRPFESEESLLFFGRHEQTLALLQQLHETRFLAVVGNSGCGKSSLVRAGLIPKLEAGFLVAERDRWRIAKMKPGDSPLANLAAAVFEALSENATQQDIARFDQSIREQGVQALLNMLAPNLQQANANLLFLVDQFEDLFRFSLTSENQAYHAEASDFVVLLLCLAEQREVPVYVTLTMRSDFLGDLDAYPGLPEALNRSQYLVPRLTRQQRREAIEGPIRLYGATMAPRLVDHLLNETIDTRDDLPVLQHALMRTWGEWQHDGKGAIDIAHYEKTGTIDEALSRHAEEAVKDMDEPTLRLTKRLFQTLTETDAANRRIRRPSHLSEIAAITGASREQISQIIQLFRSDGRSFLMLSSPNLRDDSLVDISHESLIRQWQRLADWVNEEARSARIYARLADSAQLHREGKAGYYRDPDLQIALDWQKQQSPTLTWAKRYHPEFETAIEFLQESHETNQAETAAREEQRRRQLRRTRLFSAQGFGFALILVIMAGVNIYAIRKMAALKEDIEEVTANRLPRATAITDFDFNTSSLRVIQLQYTFTIDTTEQRRQREKMIQLLDKINENFDTYVRLKAESEARHVYSEEERKLFADIDRKWEAYQDWGFAFYGLLAENKTREAFVLLKDNAQDVFNELGTDLAELVKINIRDSLAAAHRAEQAYRAARNVSTVLFIVTIILSAMLAIIFIRFIQGE